MVLTTDQAAMGALFQYVSRTTIFVVLKLTQSNIFVVLHLFLLFYIYNPFFKLTRLFEKNTYKRQQTWLCQALTLVVDGFVFANI